MRGPEPEKLEFIDDELPMPTDPVTEVDLEIAQIAMAIDGRRVKDNGLPRMGRQKMRRLLAKKIAAAGVRSAAGLAQRK